MTSTTSFTRAAVCGLAATLTAGVLVALGGTAASAGTGSTTYTCDFPGLGALPVPVATTVPDLPDTPAGESIPAGSLDPAFVFDTTSIAGVLALVTNPSAAGMAFGVGDQSVPLSGFAFGAPSGSSLPASADSDAFAAPATPGVYDVTMPESFDFTGFLGPTPVSAPCVTDTAAVLGTLTVLEGGGLIPTTTEAKAVKKRIMKGKPAKIKVSTIAGVDPVTQPAAGTVTVTKGKKKVGEGVLEDGAAVIKTKKFKKPGRYTLTVNYLGDMLSAASSDKVKIRVVKRRRR